MKQGTKEEKLAALIEAILFTHGEPFAISRLKKVTGAGEHDIRKATAFLRDEYNGRGLVILEKDNALQLGTNPEYSPILEELVKGDLHEELSRASLETLAIIAYKGPLTRVEIEYIRGVHSSFTIRTLLLRGLVERTENPRDARSPMYRISFDCLTYLGITKQEDFPHYQDVLAEFTKSAGNEKTADYSPA